MKLKSNKGSIAIFVLVGLLFMSAFLIIMYAANVNRSKAIQEQFNIISGIYSKGNDEASYTDAYTALRKKNRQTMTAYSENSNTLELTKTFNENMSNYRIYGNSIQNDIPSSSNPVEVQSVGDLVTDVTDANYGKYKITVKESGKNLLDMRKAKGGTNNGVTGVVNSDGTVSCSGTATNININIWLLGGYTQTKELLNLPTGEYYISDCTIFSYDGTTRKEKSGYFEVTEEEYPNGFSVTAVRFKQTKVGTDWNGVMLHPMIERGKVQGEYEQYVEPIITNIYLDEPLRKIGDSTDYIDIKNQKIIRNVEVLDDTGTLTIEQSLNALATPIEESITLPELQTFEDYTRIEVLTEVIPSKIEAEYMGYTLD